MRLLAKIRKTVKWAGVILAVVLVAIWLGTAECEVGWRNNFDSTLSLCNGRLKISGRDLRPRPHPPAEWFFEPRPQTFALWFSGPTVGLIEVQIPIWVFVILALVPSGIAWRLELLADRLATIRHCAKCGYDLSATPAASRCPECGNTKMLSLPPK